MQRYFALDKRDDLIILDESDLHHIVNVMRMRSGDFVEAVFDKVLYKCKVVIDDGVSVFVDSIMESFDNSFEIVLIVPVLKEQKMDLVLQKATELGVSRIIPIMCERCVVKLNDKESRKLDRWNRIVKEASEQCKRISVPVIDSVCDISSLNFSDGVKLVCSTAEKEKNLKENIESYKNTIELLKDRPDALNSLNNLDNSLKALKKDIQSILGEKQENWRLHSENLKKEQKAFEQAEKDYDVALNARRNAERTYEQNQAGILAKGLEEGKKCPVCGSTHHPEPAMLPEDSVTEEKLNQLKKKENEARESKDKLLLNVTAERTALKGAEDNIREASAKCFNNELISASTDLVDIIEILEEIKSAKSSVEQLIADNEKKKSQVGNDCITLEETRKLLDKAQGIDSDAINEQKNINTTDLQNTSVKLAEANTSLKDIGELAFNTWEEAEERKKEAEKKARKLTDAIKTADEKKKAAETAVAEKKASINTLMDNLERLKKDENELENNLHNKLKEYGFDDINTMKQFVVTEEIITKAETVLKDYETGVELNKTQLIQAEKDAEGKILTDVDVLKEDIAVQQEKVNKLRNRKSEIDLRIRTNTNKKTNIENQIEKLESARKNNVIMKTLYDLVRGQTRNGKITLEQLKLFMCPKREDGTLFI